MYVHVLQYDCKSIVQLPQQVSKIYTHSRQNSSVVGTAVQEGCIALACVGAR